MLKKALLIILIFVVSLSAIVYAFLYLHLGAEYPLKDVTGCYHSRLENAEDIICLNPPSSYTQLLKRDGEEAAEYNRGALRTFERSSNSYIGVVLYEFQILDAQGNVLETKEYDIQPHRDTFFAPTFEVSAGEWGSTYVRRHYYRKRKKN